MNPIAADTLRWMPVTYSARIPPMSANGTLMRISAACFNAPNALKSKRKIRNTLSGTMTLSRAMARCWFSNSPPHAVE